MAVFGIQLNEYNYYQEFIERLNKVIERQKNSLNPMHSLIKLKHRPLGNNTVAIHYQPQYFKVYWLGIFTLLSIYFVWGIDFTFWRVFSLSIGVILTSTYIIWTGRFLFFVINRRMKKTKFQGKLTYKNIDDIADELL